MARDLLQDHPRLRLRVYRAMFAIAEALPLWASHALGYGLGWLAWFCDPRGRRIVAHNLAHFVPARDALARCVRRNYIAFAWSIGESFAMGRIPKRYFQAPYLRVVDPWGVFAKRPRKEATIFASVHCNWELATAMYHSLSFVEEISTVALPHGDDRIDQLFERMRARFNCSSLLLDRAPLAALRVLRDGKNLCLLSERDYTGNGLTVRFAGDRARIPVGPAALAIQTGAAIVPWMLARRSAERFMIILGKPMRADPDLPKGPQIQRMTQDLADVFTRYLAAAPAQWVAFHPAFLEPTTPV